MGRARPDSTLLKDDQCGWSREERGGSLLGAETGWWIIGALSSLDIVLSASG